MIQTREMVPDDAGHLVRLMNQVDQETENLLYEPGERPDDEQHWRDKIGEMTASQSGAVLLAEVTGPGRERKESGAPDSSKEIKNPEKELAGYLEIRRMPFRKVKHRVYIVIGVLAKYGGKGVGTRLMNALDDWARKNGVRRLFLTVIAKNERAVGLYKKSGYVIEGRHPASMCINGRFVEELTMGKWLDPVN